MQFSRTRGGGWTSPVAISPSIKKSYFHHHHQNNNNNNNNNNNKQIQSDSQKKTMAGAMQLSRG
jgi:hypothetical protein